MGGAVRGRWQVAGGRCASVSWQVADGWRTDGARRGGLGYLALCRIHFIFSIHLIHYTNSLY